MSTLFIVATPIGNLEDITLRALRILKSVDAILCEDTRHTGILLSHHNISKPTISYHQHSRLQKLDAIIAMLKDGKNLALVSDAGTPALSDPGGVLVSEVSKQLGTEVRIETIPGPSALTALIAVAGIPTDKFLFLGFLPHKNGRQTLFKQIADSEITTIFYESTHRILKTLDSLCEVLDEHRQIVIGRELTKQFETIYRGSAKEIREQLTTETTRGEFVVAVAGK